MLPTLPGNRLRMVALTLLGVIAACAAAYGQHEYDVWYFGPSCSIDFATSPPTYRYPFPLRQDEGVATMCDRKTGRTLFYTDGITVWDSTHRKMQNGDSLYGSETSVQSALVVPMPCNPQGYYIFTADQQGYSRTGPAPRGINYSIVDMNAAGGRGAITSKNIPLQAEASEKQIAVSHANGSDYWVITHSIGGNTFYAWRVGPAGVATTPITSSVGFFQGQSTEDDALQALGSLKSSPDGKRLAMTTWSYRQVEIFDFDAATGRVSNPILLFEGDRLDTNRYRPYGVSFSPDNSKLYHSIWGTLVQYSLDAGNAAAIIASRRTISSIDPAPFPVSGALQIGPDGRLYIVHDSLWIGYLEYPDALGDLAGYHAKWLQMPWEALFVHGLPNNIDARATVQLPPEKTIQPSAYVTLCDGDPATLTAPSGFSEYYWSTEEKTQSIVVRDSGTYLVWMTDPNGCLVRAAVIVEVHPRPTPQIIPPGPVNVCEDEVPRISVTQSYVSYRWSTGEVTQSILPTASGQYIVSVVDSNGCEGSDTIALTIHPKPKPVIAGGGRYCAGDTAVLDAGSGYTRYMWSTGDTTQMLRLGVSAIVTVTVWDSFGCRGVSPPIDVTIKAPIVPVLQPGGTIEICEGDTATITATAGYAHYYWSNGDTGRILRGTVGGAYTVVVEDEDGCRGGSISTMLIVHPRPSIPTIARNGDTLRTSPAWRLQWSYNNQDIPGANGEWIQAIAPGLYHVTVFDSNGCGTPSVPYRIIRPHQLSFDTVSTQVGERRYLTLRSTPPIEQREMLTRYDLVFQLPHGSIFVHRILDADGTSLQAQGGSLPGEYVISRDGGPIEGAEVLRVEFEGLSTGIPLNDAPILRVDFLENDSVRSAGDGLIILQGCDISRGFDWGRRILIRAVNPNPAASSVSVVYRSPLRRTAHLLLVDPLGGTSETWELPEGDGKDATIDIDLSAFAQGAYRLVIRDGVEIDAVPLLIVR